MSTISAGLALLGDVGGTNARFALADITLETPRILESHALQNSDFASLQHAIEHYLDRVGARPRTAAIAVACPVNEDEIRLTNRAWSFSRRELAAALGFDRLHMLNDFGAVAWAIPALGREDLLTLHEARASPSLRGPVTVLGPGTGLGVALLHGDRDNGWHVIETEGGHVSFAPQGEEERQIERWMSARHGRTSNERLLCGKGLSEIDAVMRGIPAIGAGGPVLPGEATLTEIELRHPADIVSAALDGHDVAARQALARFCAVLGSVAGDCALVHGARHVVVAGGIIPRFIPFLRSSAFREKFLAKGRFAAHLERVGVHVITHPHPGLLGAAMYLHEVDQ